MTWYFVFFFVSGFCSILYELIWLRLAMAQFSVTTAFVSIVLSTFMAAWVWGRLQREHGFGDMGKKLESRLFDYMH